MNEKRRMTLEEFDRGLSAHGPDPALWPEAGAAAALLETSSAARRALAEARLIAGAVAAARAEETQAPEALLARILADADDIAFARRAAEEKASPAPAKRGAFAALRRWAFFPALRPAAICAVSASIGIWLGQSAVVADTAAALTENQETVEMIDLYGGSPEEQELAFAFRSEMGGW